VRSLAVAAAIACTGCAHGGGLWLDVFAPYPRARELCGDRIGEIAFRTYATTAAPDEVAAFYKSAHPRLIDPTAKNSRTSDLVTLQAPGERVLAVMPNDRHAPSCGAQAGRDDRTIIVVSQALRR
jgi:hypothetical protein